MNWKPRFSGNPTLEIRTEAFRRSLKCGRFLEMFRSVSMWDRKCPIRSHYQKHVSNIGRTQNMKCSCCRERIWPRQSSEAGFGKCLDPILDSGFGLFCSCFYFCITAVKNSINLAVHYRLDSSQSGRGNIDHLCFGPKTKPWFLSSAPFFSSLCESFLPVMNTLFVL